MAAPDYYDGAGGWDTVSFREEGGSSGAVVDLGAGTATDTFGNAETIINVEELEGSANDDTFTGSAGDNTFRTLAGNDVIDGGAGWDTVSYDHDAQFGGTGGINADLAAGSIADGFGGHRYGDRDRAGRRHRSG